MKYAQLVTRSKHSGNENISNILDEFTAKELYNSNVYRHGVDCTFELREVENPTKEQLKKLHEILSYDLECIKHIQEKLPEYNSEERVKHNLKDDTYWSSRAQMNKITLNMVDIQLNT